MELRTLLQTVLDPTTKGLPDVGIRGTTLEDIRRRGWNLLRGDLPIPVATLDQDTLNSNSQWMSQFAARHGVSICPHGKTTMAPQLFELQLNDGAWGITVASVQQLRVCWQFGVQRVLMANQLVGDGEMRAVFRMLSERPEMEFYCLVDSPENVGDLCRTAEQSSFDRPLRVLLEAGIQGGRAGCRTLKEAIALAHRVRECAPRVALCGVEGFEGVISEIDDARSVARAKDFLQYLSNVAERIHGLGLFDVKRPIFTVGGSVYFDLAATHPAVRALGGRYEVVLRAGCYLTHDSGVLSANFQKARIRTPELALCGEGLRPALRVWGRVQSMPEPMLAIVNVGKRDISYDIELPVAEAWFRPDDHTSPRSLGHGITTTQINDQHIFLSIPADCGMRIGDLVGFGVSHPCTTFDKWRLIYVTNRHHDVVDAVVTFF